MILSYVAREYEKDNIISKFIWHNLVFLVISDIFVNAITYKLYYGRSIIHEVNDTTIKDKHDYDDETHKYHEKPEKPYEPKYTDSSSSNKKYLKQQKDIGEYIKSHNKLSDLIHKKAEPEHNNDSSYTSDTDDDEIPPEIVHKSDNKSVILHYHIKKHQNR